VVAADESELPRLRDLHERGLQNGLEGLRMMGASEMREIEPHVGGVAALRVPQEGIVDYARVCAALVPGIHGRVITGAKALAMRQISGDGWCRQPPEISKPGC
jgi:L-2-hydroxyglutarate oxidase